VSRIKSPFSLASRVPKACHKYRIVSVSLPRVPPAAGIVPARLAIIVGRILRESANKGADNDARAIECALMGGGGGGRERIGAGGRAGGNNVSPRCPAGRANSVNRLATRALITARGPVFNYRVNAIPSPARKFFGP
jgi:hypothetical protein